MAEFDLVVRSGTVVDGAGGEPRAADVAVKHGVIAEVGRVTGRGTREIDAEGAIVSPGFVDVHTHYDGQATWDDRLQPSSLHGVTTVVAGNCGVGFAPVRPEDRDQLIALMEGVEDIPGTALHEGLKWDWVSFPEYLDSLERRPRDIDLATQVPHAALRLWAMGGRAVAYEAATPDEIATMAELAKQAICAGALGFSTSRTLNHKTKKGVLTPVYGSAEEELVTIARAIGTLDTGVLQLITDFPDIAADFEVIRQMVKASGRPLTVSLVQFGQNPQQYREVLSYLTKINSEGLPPVRAQVAVRSMGMLMGLECTLHPFMMNPVWRALSHLPVSEQARRMRNPDLRASILAAQTDEKDSNLPGGTRIDRFDIMHEFAVSPDYEPSADTSLAARAAQERRTPEDLAYDILISDDGRALIYQPFTNYADKSLDAVREMLVHDDTIPGLSDGGAHVASISDGSFPTTLLQYWVRDRVAGKLELPYVIQQQCRDTARALGLFDRGELRPGYKADLNVIDLTRLQARRPEMLHDLPGGGKRLMQRADGYRHTFVSGIETYRDSEPVGPLPGKLIRGARPAPGQRELIAQ